MTTPCHAASARILKQRLEYCIAQVTAHHKNILKCSLYPANVIAFASTSLSESHTHTLC